MIPAIRPGTRRSAASVTLCISALLAGCASPPGSPDAAANAVTENVSAPQSEHPALVTRKGRYTLARTDPRAGQTNLLNQIIEIRIPQNFEPTVHEALQYTLLRSGYHLCPGSEESRRLFAHPLPGSHHQLGPITLRRALEVIAGPAWQLQTDELNREICFSVREAFKHSERPQDHSPVINAELGASS